MDILLSNLPPIGKAGKKTFQDVFEECSIQSDLVRIAVGYIAVDPLAYLYANIIAERFPSLELVIGMHAFDGFSTAGFQSAVKLEKLLADEGKGRVDLCTAAPFHGKVYVFQKQGKPFSAIVGSSNLSDIVGNTRYEVNVLLTEKVQVSFVNSLVDELQAKNCRPLSRITPKIVSNIDTLLSDVHGVERVSRNQLHSLLDRRVGEPIAIPLKTEERSNLNAFHGKGRLNNSTGFVRPRPWYEVELIIPKEITSRRQFPKKGLVFKVVTDDGWSFLCKTSGDYGKNFRSENDLKILGMWIKGRLEDSGALNFGEKVTAETLLKYGRDNIELISTSETNTWILDFSRP